MNATEINWAKNTEWSGDTYGIRDWLKKAGAKWDAVRKVWTLEGGMLTRPEKVQAGRLTLQHNISVTEIG